MSHFEFLIKTLEKYKERDSDISRIEKIISDTSKTIGEKKSHPNKPNLNKISSTGETSLQRAIFNGEKSKLGDTNEEIKWLDLEVPIVLSANSRRNCIDLLGLSGNSLVVTELKFGNSLKTDSPFYGILELAVYYYFLLENHKKLDKYKVYHKTKQLENIDFSWEKYICEKNIKLIFAANSEYFKYWTEHRKISIDDLHYLTKEIENEFKVPCEIYKMEDENFIEQKNKSTSLDGRYSPKLENDGPWIRI